MSRIYGDTFQVAYVVPDVDEAVAYWTDVMGVGPFFDFPLPLPFEELAVRGEPVALDAPIFGAISVAFSGDLMIELIQPGSAPSTYREFLEGGNRGVHHFGTFVEDFDAAMQSARDAGVPVVLEGRLPMSRFAYLDTARDGVGPIVEIIRPNPPMLEAFDMMREAARDWDGSEPRRSM